MVAVVILAHKNLEQVKRLIDTLRHPDVDVYLHVDSKCELDESDFPMADLVKRYNIKWGSSRHLEAVFNSLKKAVNRNYEHYILMSGQDYLICNIDDIVNFLNENKDKSFMDYTNITGSDSDIRNRYLTYNTRFKFLNIILQKILPNRKLFKGLSPYWGSGFWILNDEAAKYLVGEYYTNYQRKLFLTRSIDEVFYQTILLNSPFKKNIINDTKWYISWKDSIDGLTEGRPDILTENDYDSIIKSDKFFARKFDISVDEKVLDLLDEYQQKTNK